MRPTRFILTLALLLSASVIFAAGHVPTRMSVVSEITKVTTAPQIEAVPLNAFCAEAFVLHAVIADIVPVETFVIDYTLAVAPVKTEDVPATGELRQRWCEKDITGLSEPLPEIIDLKRERLPQK